MTYQQHQQEKEPYIDPPNSPIPPLTKLPGQEKLPLAFSRLCRYCKKVQLIIKQEHIADDKNGEPRFRYVPRDSKTMKIHNCRVSDNTLNHGGVN